VTEFAHLDLSLIDPNPAQPRLDMGDLTPLADSIREQGVVEPIVVARAGDRYTLIAGHRRVEASILAEQSTIPAVVHDTVDEHMQIAALIAENTVRTDDLLLLHPACHKIIHGIPLNGTVCGPTPLYALTELLASRLEHR
jgi:ParB/RepB/Spo0J family partition protein